jgi:hypothetical protein
MKDDITEVESGLGAAPTASPASNGVLSLLRRRFALANWCTAIGVGVVSAPVATPSQIAFLAEQYGLLVVVIASFLTFLSRERYGAVKAFFRIIAPEYAPRLLDFMTMPHTQLDTGRGSGVAGDASTRLTTTSTTRAILGSGPAVTCSPNKQA